MSAKPPAAVTRTEHRVPRGSHTLHALHERPAAAADGVHVLAHGFCSSHASSTLRAVATALHARGMATLSLDFSGNGASEGKFRFAGYWEEVEDLRALCTWAQRRGMPIGSVTGHSKAGTVVTDFAGRYPELCPSLVILCGRYDMVEGLRERVGVGNYEAAMSRGSAEVTPAKGAPYIITREDIVEREGIDSGRLCALVRCRTLIVHGTADATIPVADSGRFEEALRTAPGAPEVRRVVIEGANHRFSEHREALGAAVAEFVS